MEVEGALTLGAVGRKGVVRPTFRLTVIALGVRIAVAGNGSTRVRIGIPRIVLEVVIRGRAPVILKVDPVLPAVLHDPQGHRCQSEGHKERENGSDDMH